MDDNEKVVLGKLFPFNYAGKNGQFSCIVKTDIDSDDNFEGALMGLSVGDEIAVKAGKRHLGVAAKYCDPIRSINLFACSMGIAPALQMTQYFSRQSDLIDSVDFLWINKEKNGFVCDDDVQDLDNKLGDKLKVSRFINAYLNDINVFESEDFMSTIPSYEYGRITVVCGPAVFVDVLKKIAQRKGFAPENILTIQTN